ncbi:MAG: PQQ-dependent dehydrogenase, methanol/ethanol family [Rhodospirillaceae bacterium]|nr:PQQ-dependent dehydrogenase, methanol/ethanol family [Rhodospirillaceae bacterium]
MRVSNLYAFGTTFTAVAALWASVAGADPVTSDDLLSAAGNTSEWLMYGRTYDNQRYSPLDKINTGNVGDMKPVWAFSTGGKLGGLEATPLIADGVLYFSADYARVFAVDARTGTMVWYYEPQYDDGMEAELCCGPVNRGVAIKDDKVYVETLDARLVALNRADGTVAWEKTIDDWKAGYTATGAPLVIGDQVVVGIAGAEYGVRGYIRSYDAESGAENWTTYAIPGPGEPGNDSWPGDTWKTGGASTWQTGTYDAETNTLYWGTGNPGPWNSDMRTGDNKWSCSVIAVDATTGKFKWGYQYTPNDAWDYDGNNAPILADVTVDGKSVKAALQTNRNGFLYTLDRTSGGFVNAVPTIDGINWTTGLDPKTGRPTVNEKTRALSGGDPVKPVIPGLEGGTNWFPASYDPNLGYMFINTNHWAMQLDAWPKEDVVYKPGDLYMGVDFQMYRLDKDIGYTKAFDVAKQEFVWSTPSPLPMFAGILSTGGGLIFTGDELGNVLAMNSKTGEVLWEFQTGSGINASPITYELDGTQYVAILSGLGGDPGFYFQGPKGGMLWVFSVDGKKAKGEGWNPTPIEGALPQLD